jgi:hypothetical protein
MEPKTIIPDCSFASNSFHHTFNLIFIYNSFAI